MHDIWRKVFLLLITIAVLAEVLLFRGHSPTFASGPVLPKTDTTRPMTTISYTTDLAAKPTIFTASSVLTLRASEIDGTNAHLSIFPDPLHPTLTFASNIIYGMRLSQPLSTLTLTMVATGVAVANGVTIKTSVLSDLTTAIGSFVNKADLLILVAGGTVKNLVMKNVTLKIDRYLDLNSLNAQGLQVSIS